MITFSQRDVGANQSKGVGAKGELDALANSERVERKAQRAPRNTDEIGYILPSRHALPLDRIPRN